MLGTLFIYLGSCYKVQASLSPYYHLLVAASQEVLELITGVCHHTQCGSVYDEIPNVIICGSCSHMEQESCIIKSVECFVHRHVPYFFCAITVTLCT